MATIDLEHGLPITDPIDDTDIVDVPGVLVQPELKTSLLNKPSVEDKALKGKGKI